MILYLYDVAKHEASLKPIFIILEALRKKDVCKGFGFPGLLASLDVAT